MSLASAFDWLQNRPFATEIRESDWLFPSIETVHVFALVLVIGSIMTVDLRMLGLAHRHRPFSELAKEMLPWTWSAFVVAAIAGTLMFCSKALTYYANLPFRIKMACLVLAALNMLAFHWLGERPHSDWSDGAPPARVRFAGAASLLLWTAIVATGRWIGFTT